MGEGKFKIWREREGGGGGTGSGREKKTDRWTERQRDRDVQTDKTSSEIDRQIDKGWRITHKKNLQTEKA